MRSFLALGVSMFPFLRMLAMLLFCVMGVAAVASERLGNESVVEMVKLGLDDELIVGKIQSSPSHFDTSATAMKALSDAGVSTAVIKAMLVAGAPVAGGASGPEFYLLGADGEQTALSAVRVNAEISNRKRWIPVYGAFAQPETFMFIQGEKASLRVGSQADFLTRIDPLQIRLVHLGLHKSGKRFVVFSANSSDREREFGSEQLGNGLFRLRPSAELPAGEYAYLVAGEIASGMGWWAWFAVYGAQAAKAYDFGIN